MTGRPVVFGEVLVDRFPDGAEVLGGAPFNVAWNLRGLGLDPVLVSRVGDDDSGEAILGAMEEMGLDRSGIQRDRARPTGVVVVSIEDGEPRYDIRRDVAYDAIEPRLPIPPGEVAIVYHGSLALRSSATEGALASLLTTGYPVGRAPHRALFFDVNLRDPFWSRNTIERWWGRAEEIKLNADELRRLVPFADDVERRARTVLGITEAREIHVTLGAEGALTVSREGDVRRASPASPATVVDTVGAGDAFSAVLIAGRLRDWSIETRIDRAVAFAAAVVGLRGATTTDPDFYARFRDAWSLT